MDHILNFPNGIGQIQISNSSGAIASGNPLPVDIGNSTVNINVSSGNLNVSVSSGAVSILNSGSFVSPSNPFPVTFSGNPVNIGYSDTAALDAFGRLRVSNPVTLFDCQLVYGLENMIFNDVSTGGGSVSANTNEACAVLSVGGTLNDKMVRQTKQYFRYQPGKSHLIFQTFVFGASKNGVRKRIGYFDGSNGLFLEQIPAGVGTTGLRFVVRTSTTGSPIDFPVDSSAWNIDPMDGTGPSGINLDITKSQILFIDLEWLGVGRVRFGFVIDGNIYYAHQVLNTNVLDKVYMTTADLPVRAEIENTSGGNIDSMKMICSSVNSEGGFSKAGLPFAIGNGVNTKIVTTRRPIISIKPNTTFNSVVNRMGFDISDINVFSQTNTAYYEIVLNGSLNSGSFTNVQSGYSCMSYDTNSTVITGGVVLACGYAVAGGPGSNAIGEISAHLAKIPFSVNYAGTDSDVLTVVATCIEAAPKTSTVGAVFNWQEIR